MIQSTYQNNGDKRGALPNFQTPLLVHIFKTRFYFHRVTQKNTISLKLITETSFPFLEFLPHRKLVFAKFRSHHHTPCRRNARSTVSYPRWCSERCFQTWIKLDETQNGAKTSTFLHLSREFRCISAEAPFCYFGGLPPQQMLNIATWEERGK